MGYDYLLDSPPRFTLWWGNLGAGSTEFDRVGCIPTG